jgi:hypothetical protein
MSVERETLAWACLRHFGLEVDCRSVDEGREMVVRTVKCSRDCCRVC